MHSRMNIKKDEDLYRSDKLSSCSVDSPSPLYLPLWLSFPGDFLLRANIN